MARLGSRMTEPACGPVKGHVGDIRGRIQVTQGIAFPDVAHGAVDIGCCRVGAGAAAIVRGDGECGGCMAALALYFCAVVKLQAGVVALAEMADGAGFETICMDGLGACMTQAAGGPVKGHVGDIRGRIQVTQRIAFPDVAHGTVDIGGGRMGAGAAAVVRGDGEGVQHVAALALYFCAVVKLQAGVVTCAAMAEGARLGAVYVACLGVRMAQAAGPPLEWHVGDIGDPVQVLDREAFLDMADGAVDICNSCMDAASAAIVGVYGEYSLRMATLAQGLRTVGQIQAGVVARPCVADVAWLKTRLMDGLGIQVA